MFRMIVYKPLAQFVNPERRLELSAGGSNFRRLGAVLTNRLSAYDLDSAQFLQTVFAGQSAVLIVTDITG